MKHIIKEGHCGEPDCEVNRKKRTWIYVLLPVDYALACDICGGSNIMWSEWEGHIWCQDCQKDTPGTGGIFDGPIPYEITQMNLILLQNGMDILPKMLCPD